MCQYIRSSCKYEQKLLRFSFLTLILFKKVGVLSSLFKWSEFAGNYSGLFKYGERQIEFPGCRSRSDLLEKPDERGK